MLYSGGNISVSIVNYICQNYELYLSKFKTVSVKIILVFVKMANVKPNYCLSSDKPKNYHIQMWKTIHPLIRALYVQWRVQICFVIVNWRCWMWKVLICNQNYPSDGQEEWIKTLTSEIWQSEIQGTEIRLGNWKLGSVSKLKIETEVNWSWQRLQNKDSEKKTFSFYPSFCKKNFFFPPWKGLHLTHLHGDTGVKLMLNMFKHNIDAVHPTQKSGRDFVRRALQVLMQDAKI